MAELRKGLIAGVVVGSDGRPIAEAAVTLASLSSMRPFSAKTNADGRFVIDGLTPGRYIALAVTTEVRMANMTLNVNADRVASAILRLDSAIRPTTYAGALTASTSGTAENPVPEETDGNDEDGIGELPSEPKREPVPEETNNGSYKGFDELPSDSEALKPIPEQRDQRGKLSFQYQSRRYLVDMAVTQTGVILLPDGTLLKVVSWLESDPPQIGSLRKMNPSKQAAGTDLEEIATIHNALMAVFRS